MGKDLAVLSEARSLVEDSDGETHPQAPPTCKERELGWLCGHPAWEGVHTVPQLGLR